MALREALNKVLAELTEEHQQELLDFAQFLVMKQDQREWSQMGMESVARECARDEEAASAENQVAP